MPKPKKKNLHIPFALLLGISLPLVLFMSYISFKYLLNNFWDSISKQNIAGEKISLPSYSLSEISLDTDLNKLPSDYDSLISSLNISLTQHQKMTLLLYGQTVVKTNQTNISDAYKELTEEEIPILIPQQYINEYVNQQLRKYSEGIDSSNPDLEKTIVTHKETFDNEYEQYIYNEISTQLPLKEQPDETDMETYPHVKNFLLDIDEENINLAYYKTRVINSLSKKVNTKELVNLLNNLVILSKDTNDINTTNRLSKQLKGVVYNPNLNKEGLIYWKISVINGKSYVHPMYISSEYDIDDNNFNDNYDVVPLAQGSGSTRVPILMYHHIANPPSNKSSFVTNMYVTPEIFEQQLAYLVKKNFKSITPRQLYDLLKKGQNPSQKSVMITFDDGALNNFTNAYPLLKKYGFTGVFYIVSNRKLLTSSQLKEMADNGMIIDSHSATHIDLSKVSNAQTLYTEIVGSKNTLRAITGKEVNSFAYPGCVGNQSTFSQVAKAGYLLGTSCGRGIDHSFSNRLALHRVKAFNNMESFVSVLSGKY